MPFSDPTDVFEDKPSRVTIIIRRVCCCTMFWEQTALFYARKSQKRFANTQVRCGNKNGAILDELCLRCCKQGEAGLLPAYSACRQTIATTLRAQATYSAGDLSVLFRFVLHHVQLKNMFFSCLVHKVSGSNRGNFPNFHVSTAAAYCIN